MRNSPKFSEASKIADINQQFHEQSLPVLTNVREEQQHVLALLNGLLDKVLDLGKILIGISFPALIALFSLKKEDFNTGPYLLLSLVLFVFGLLIFIGGVLYKFMKISPYVHSSSIRLRSYTEMLETARLRAQLEDNKIAWSKIKKNRKSS